MKQSLILLVSVILLFSCSKQNSKLKESITGSDSVAINYFTGDGKMDTVLSVKIIHDKEVMEQLARFITASGCDVKQNCGYDGSLHFFRKNIVVQDVYFRMNDEACRQFTFSFEGKTAAARLSNEAVAVLRKLK